MDASPVVMVLISAGVVFACAAFFFDIRHQRSARLLGKWVVAQRPGVWEQLPWLPRQVVPQAGLAILRKGTLKGDDEFLTLYRQVSYWKNRFLVALILGMMCFVVVGVGTKLLDWAW